MYEQIMISKMLDIRDTSMLSEQGLHPEMFLNTQAELNFILAHENKYKCVPDHATFIAEFPDFELYSSNEDIGFISEKIKDNFLECILRLFLMRQDPKYCIHHLSEYRLSAVNRIWQD